MVYLSINSKRLPLLEGLEVLNRDDLALQQAGEEEIVEIEVSFPENDALYFKGDFPLGSGESESFFSWIEETLLKQYPEEEEAICELVLALVDEKERALEELNQGKNQPVEVVVETVSLPPKEERLPPKSKTVSESTSSPSKKKKKKREKKQSFNINKMMLVSGISAMLLVGGGITYRLLTTPTSQTIAVQDMFETELSQLSPEEIGKKYPNRTEEIVTFYVEKGQFDDLSVFNTLFPTPDGTFDLAFYHKEWEQVVQTPVNTLNEDRKIMLAHAYIQLGRLDEATVLNEQLQSEKLALEMDKKRLTDIVEALHQSDLKKAKQLGEQLTTTSCKEAYQVYYDDATLIIKMIDLYKNKKDSDNMALWQRKLEKIGDVTNNDI
ncbi:hypothetical protein [Vagococcus xieshaowenii]|uniref:Uncharacterized protein n=1 Tax=Vagococcus xieshaowenii TaxID=2562451 RepID=A0AAJ5EHB8_9ENTE|nr:hypothetical protein [Vagococcus xieshaowenii]QCA29677.1 hypothetical protein E4Z98_09835 [Vagococcus xieshaowenii]TFZ42952.1 hypothetical protein E4031_01575 [Vagococcus xieshaowenii]